MNDLGFSVSIPLVIATYGVAIGVAAVLWYLFKKRRLAGWTRVSGRVESYEAIPGEDGGFRYNPRVVFWDSFGREVRFQVAAQWTREVYEVGGEIPVLFCPSDSRRAVIDRWAESYTEVIVLGILSVFMLSGAAGMAIFFHSAK